jgi:hypothetical protein
LPTFDNVDNVDIIDNICYFSCEPSSFSSFFTVSFLLLISGFTRNKSASTSSGLSGWSDIGFWFSLRLLGIEKLLTLQHDPLDWHELHAYNGAYGVAAMTENDFIDQLRQELAQAEAELATVLEKQSKLEKKASALREAVHSYRSILQYKTSQFLPGSSATLWGDPPDSINGSKRGAPIPGNRSPNMPPRNAAFAQVSIANAITRIMESADHPLHADELARGIWNIRTATELSLCKKSLNSDLARLLRKGKLHRTAPNTFTRVVMATQ